ncbi:MAG TPA: SRPBCC family protein [Symbiobacteriaceae bacterium]|jgi:carbon monoxide dehydrogenase subunit G
MPDVTHTLTINAPIVKVWSFVNNLRNWATLMPGYQDFTELDADNSVWKLKGDVGILQKLITLRAQVTGREEPSRVAFVLQGVDENLQGSGAFVASPAAGNTTDVKLSLSLKAGGLMGPMVNALLGNMVPSYMAALATGIKSRVEE